MIDFPQWVTGPDVCKTRTFSVVLINRAGVDNNHGSNGMRIEKAFVNRPTKVLPRKGVPGFYTAWA